MNQLIGKSIRGYELREIIGEGGFGTIYRAFQPVIQRDVAIKIILPVHANNPEFIRRFETEAQLVARLESLHIVPLYDYWRDPEGAYLVMRWLRAGTLQMLLERQRLDMPTISRILSQIGSALSIAHRHKVVHRDIKPANILLDEENNAYLTDFGIAYSTEYGAAPELEGQVTGTFAYLSPEQVTGDIATPASDIYSLGIVLYEMVAGKHPFGGVDLTELIYKQMYSPLPELPIDPSLPEAINAVIQKATQKDPTARYSDVLEMVQDFSQAMERRGHRVQTFIDLPNPYKGLRAFDEADASAFFGRTSLIHHLVEELKDETEYQRFLAVVGPSGSGKSSVVKAGLIPALRADAISGSSRWFYAFMNPNVRPMEELVQALTSIAFQPVNNLEGLLNSDANGLIKAIEILLSDNDNDVVLVIDQFEEVFTQTTNVEEARQFLRLIQTAVTHPTSRLRIIITLRADFYDRPLLQPGLSDLMRKRTEVVIPLTSAELEEAIVGPLAGTGIEMEAGLVAAIVSDVNEQPGALPMLQYTLTELFDRRDGNTIKLETYRALGGALGALASRADEVYQSLSPELQPLVRQMFLRLVTLGEGTEDTRRRATLSEIQSISDDIRSVIDVFDKSRLLTFDRDPLTREPTIEIAHEAIIREWKRLRKWLDESRGDLRLQRLLAQEAANWTNAKRDNSYLLREARLAQFENWQPDLTLTPLEKEFLDTSIRYQNEQENAEQERRAREIRLQQSNAIRTRLLVASVIVALIGVGLTLFAMYQATRATASEQEALELRAASASAALAASAQRVFLLNNDTDLGIALALESTRTENLSPIALDTLAQVALAPATRRVFQQPESDGLGLVDFSPDGQTVLVGTNDGIAFIWDLNTGEVVRTFEGHETPFVYAVAFSPDGKLAATSDGEVMLWNVETGEMLYRFGEETGEWVAFSPDGTKLVGVRNENVNLWNIETGELIHNMKAESRQISVIYSPDGKTIVSGSINGQMYVWDAETGNRITRIQAHDGELWYLAFFPDSETVISGAYNVEGETDLKIRNIKTGFLLETLQNNTGFLSALDLNADGSRALVSYSDGSFVLWDLNQLQIIRAFRGHSNLVYGLTFSPDGQSAFASDLDGYGRLWDLRNGAEVNRLQVSEEGYALATYTEEGILAAYQNGLIVLANPENGETIWELSLGTASTIRAITTNENTFTLAAGTTIFIGDLKTGEITKSFTHSSEIRALAFDGQILLSGDDDYNVEVWDVDTGEITRTFAEHDSEVRSITLSEDGSFAVSSTEAGDFNTDTLIIWEMTTGQPRHALNPGSTSAVAISGSTIASGMNNGSILLWNAETGAQIRLLNEHSASINSLRFSADGQKLVSTSDDNTVIVWDVGAGTSDRTLYGHSDWVRSAEFSTDGSMVLSAADDGTVRQWRIITDDALIDWTHANRYVPELTCEQRTLYGVEPLCP